jgi:hypothetical protein
MIIISENYFLQYNLINLFRLFPVIRRFGNPAVSWSHICRITKTVLYILILILMIYRATGITASSSIQSGMASIQYGGNMLRFIKSSIIWTVNSSNNLHCQNVVYSFFGFATFTLFCINDINSNNTLFYTTVVTSYSIYDFLRNLYLWNQGFPLFW